MIKSYMHLRDGRPSTWCCGRIFINSRFFKISNLIKDLRTIRRHQKIDAEARKKLELPCCDYGYLLIYTDEDSNE